MVPAAAFVTTATTSTDGALANGRVQVRERARSEVACHTNEPSELEQGDARTRPYVGGPFSDVREQSPGALGVVARGALPAGARRDTSGRQLDERLQKIARHGGFVFGRDAAGAQPAPGLLPRLVRFEETTCLEVRDALEVGWEALEVAESEPGSSVVRLVARGHEAGHSVEGAAVGGATVAVFRVAVIADLAAVPDTVAAVGDGAVGPAGRRRVEGGERGA